MAELKVDLGERSYPIFIAEDILTKPELFRPYVDASQVLVVTNTTVDKLYGDALMSTLSFASKLDKVVLPDGEQFKHLDTVNKIFDALLEKKHNRKTTLIALGGGVVGDMVGFAAACYQRGVSFIQVPTTVLSQVDSSVGGKTGVNHPLGKNMIGAFHQPNSVVIDVSVLQSLPDREVSAGIAEIIKYGLIADYPFFCWLEENVEALRSRQIDALIYAIEKSCQTKADIVAEDEREGGIRAILNLGHTFGHAIEAFLGYGTWLHGEAVGAGMAMACDLSERLGWIDAAMVERVDALLVKSGLPIAPPPEMDSEVFMKYMSVDKKVLDGTLRLVLLASCGKAIVTSDFDSSKLEETFEKYHSLD
ncbi:MAG: 3-dehydroquinate synthase [Alteromonadaceae bacterium]|nr:MAG: 3-dehydroquinate synthase [Alteromonadaceae bacterium]